MIIILGKSVELPTKERKELNQQTDPTWLHVHAKLDCSFEEFIDIFPANHIQAVVGDRTRVLKYMCEIAGIKPIIPGSKEKEYKDKDLIWERIK